MRDARGDELTLFEYKRDAPFAITMGLDGAGRTRLALDTGEPVRRGDSDYFVIVGTGELLTRIA